MNQENNDRSPSTAKVFILGTLAAIAVGLVGGLLGSGVFDGITGSGMPNPGGAIGAIAGAVAGGLFTSRYLRRGDKPG